MKGIYVTQVNEKTWEVRHKYRKNLNIETNPQWKTFDVVKFVGPIHQCKAYIDLMGAGFLEEPEIPS